MRQAGTVEKEEAAHRFSDFLATLKIASRVEPTGDQWALWIMDENQLERGKQELQAFLQNPQDARYDVAEQAAAVRREEAERAQRARKNVIEVRAQWDLSSAGSLRLPMVLAACCLLVAVATNRGKQLADGNGDGLGISLLISTFQVPHPSHGVWNPEVWEMPDFGLEEVVHGQIWRLVTPILLHFGIMHLLGNMLWLFQLGGQIESRQGMGKLAVIILTSAVLSNLAQYWSTGSPLFGGMSGVVYALFGYTWMQTLYVPRSRLFMSQQTVFLMIFWFFLCTTGKAGPIANTAHGVGLAVGMLMGVAPRLWRQ